MAESFLAPEGGGKGLEELTRMWYERWEKEIVISWFEKETATVVMIFFLRACFWGTQQKSLGVCFKGGCNLPNWGVTNRAIYFDTGFFGALLPAFSVRGGQLCHGGLSQQLGELKNYTCVTCVILMMFTELLTYD